MSECGCSQTNLRFEGMSKQYKQILWAVIIINAVMFCVEMMAGFKAQSMSLKADALDFLGDTTTYLISFLVLGASLKTRATAAMVKGVSLALMGVWVFSETLYRFMIDTLPSAPIMGWVAVAAFTANLISVLLLYKYRDGDSNIKSVWLCSRNDAIANIAVMLGAIMVHVTVSKWPDLIVAIGIAGLFCQSSFLIIRQARQELREAREATPQNHCS